MRIISPKQVRFKTNISERQQDRLVERGLFPKPVALYPGGRRKGFIEEEIDEFMAVQVAARAAPQGRSAPRRRSRRTGSRPPA